jgi:predicted peptidase
MKNLLLIHSVMISVSVSAQSGKVCDNLSMERKYAIYLPPCYETSELSYPVIYLLHGSGDDQSGWRLYPTIRNGSTTVTRE